MRSAAMCARAGWRQTQLIRRLSVTAGLVEQTKLGLDLAQTRYQLGLGSIVEVSQAQLQETGAEITNAKARYDYLVAQAIIRFETGTN